MSHQKHEPKKCGYKNLANNVPWESNGQSFIEWEKLLVIHIQPLSYIHLFTGRQTSGVRFAPRCFYSPATYYPNPQFPSKTISAFRPQTYVYLFVRLLQLFQTFGNILQFFRKFCNFVRHHFPPKKTVFN